MGAMFKFSGRITSFTEGDVIEIVAPSDAVVRLHTVSVSFDEDVPGGTVEAFRDWTPPPCACSEIFRVCFVAVSVAGAGDMRMFNRLDVKIGDTELTRIEQEVDVNDCICSAFGYDSEGRLGLFAADVPSVTVYLNREESHIPEDASLVLTLGYEPLEE